MKSNRKMQVFSFLSLTLLSFAACAPAEDPAPAKPAAEAPEVAQPLRNAALQVVEINAESDRNAPMSTAQSVMYDLKPYLALTREIATSTTRDIRDATFVYQNYKRIARGEQVDQTQNTCKIRINRTCSGLEPQGDYLMKLVGVSVEQIMNPDRRREMNATTKVTATLESDRGTFRMICWKLSDRMINELTPQERSFSLNDISEITGSADFHLYELKVQIPGAEPAPASNP